MEQNYQECKRCLMDTSASDIRFDNNGICNFCSDFLSNEANRTKNLVEQEAGFKCLIERVKKSGKGKKYDCIVGVSGGVDSSWALFKTVEAGLKPLAVHMDNGWNSELAQNNISNLITKLGVDLFTYVIDWNEYKKLMQSFFDADVIDVELLYDNAMLAVNYRQAAKFGIKFILAGTNIATEGMSMPQKWNWFKYDKTNIKAIGKLFQNVALNSFPAIGTAEYVWYEILRGIKWTSFLDYLHYNKFESQDYLVRHFGFKPYPYKHYESVFTRFYQGFILPRKFGVDKRRLHLSNLIVTNQISREKGKALLSEIAYPSEMELERDKSYFLKKMGWSEEQLSSYISRKPVQHDFYPSEKKWWDFCQTTYRKYLK